MSVGHVQNYPPCPWNTIRRVHAVLRHCAFLWLLTNTIRHKCHCGGSLSQMWSENLSCYKFGWRITCSLMGWGKSAQLCFIKPFKKQVGWLKKNPPSSRKTRVENPVWADGLWWHGCFGRNLHHDLRGSDTSWKQRWSFLSAASFGRRSNVPKGSPPCPDALIWRRDAPVLVSAAADSLLAVHAGVYYFLTKGRAWTSV